MSSKNNGTIYILEDDFHSEHMGGFKTREEAMAELKKLSKLNWDDEPNRAPCTSWKTCGRTYAIIEYQVSTDREYWKIIKTEYLAEVGRVGFRWTPYQ